jgi:glycosyltransferase involved in cell wall biosynthesis/SAM-dependent methyltransferase
VAMTTSTIPVLDIVFCVAGLPFDGNTVRTGSLGGSESAGVFLARALAKRGHRVKMFCNLPPTTKPGTVIDGVDYRHIQGWSGHVLAAPHDVTIVQRAPELFVNRITSKLNILWQHDLALRRVAHLFRATKWCVDRIAVLSQFMEDQYQEVVGFEPNVLWQTRNGLDINLDDLNAKNVAPWAARDKDLLLYAARPERGLDVLIGEVFPKILKAKPNTKLALCSYANPVDNSRGDWWPKLQAQMAQLPIVQLGSLTKEQFYQVMSRAAAYVYPTPGSISPEFAEVSCINALEAQMCGLPIVCSNSGALAETAKASMRCETADDIAEATLTLLDNPGLWTGIQQNQIAHLKASRYSWDAIAADWEAMFEAEIVKKNSDPVRLAAWAYPHSDIDLAKAALDQFKEQECGDDLAQDIESAITGEFPSTNPIAYDLAGEIAEKYAFLASDEAYAAHYAALGKDEDGRLEAERAAGVLTKEWLESNRVPRFVMMAEQLKQDPTIKHVLDYGCGHGESPVFMHNKTGVTVYGHDVDPKAIEWCNWFAENLATNPAACSFTTDEETALVTWPQNLISPKADDPPGYDAAICSEVLEHVRDPIAVLERVELAVRKGGLVVITVPYGPWEFDGPCWHDLRAHVREFQQSDLYEMLGHKPNFMCGAVMCMIHPQLGEPCGFYIVTYRADHAGVRPIDMARKLKWQRPRESLSVNILCHEGGEATLRWAIEGVRHVASEIVVGDTGMTEAGRALCASLGARVVPAPNPLKEGFDAARNAVLDASVGDWILSVDSDERLTDGQELGKYLRDNTMDGYSIPQVHVTADAPVSPDAPVRLFRRTGGNRYFGMIHEHPEKEFNKGPGIVCMLSNPRLLHIGYETNNVRAARFMRNRPLLLADAEKNPDRVMGIFLQARDNLIIMNEMLARSNGNVGPQVIELAEATLKLCRQYWDAEVPLVNVDPTPFETECLRILGRGFEATVDIKIGRDNVGDQGQLAMRFEKEEDFERHLKRVTSDKIKAVTGRYW